MLSSLMKRPFRIEEAECEGDWVRISVSGTLEECNNSEGVASASLVRIEFVCSSFARVHRADGIAAFVFWSQG